jgi:hypothetical protein
MKLPMRLIIAITLLAAAPLWAATEKPIWSGPSGGFQFQWTTKDIQVRPESDPTTLLYSARRAFQKDFGGIHSSPGYVLQYARIVSLVGYLMTVETYTEGFSEGAAHPFSHSRYTTIDMQHPHRTTSLTDYFKPNDIYKALLRDKIVQTHLRGDTPASTLDALIQQLAEHNVDSQSCEHGFESDLLTRFAFYDVRGDKVAVRLGLSNAYGVCRGSLAQLGIWLPIPDSLKQNLSGTAFQDVGFLMKERAIQKPIYSSINTPSKIFLQSVTQFGEGDIANIEKYR